MTVRQNKKIFLFFGNPQNLLKSEGGAFVCLAVLLCLLAGFSLSCTSREEVRPQPQPITPVNRYGPAWLEKKQGINLLFLSGTALERATQEGALTASLLKQGLMTVMAERLRSFRNSPILDRAGVWGQLSSAEFQRLAFSGYDSHDAAVLETVASSAGISPATLKDAWLYQDIYLFLNSFIPFNPELQETSAAVVAPRDDIAFASWSDFSADNIPFMAANCSFPYSAKYAHTNLVAFHLKPDQTWHLLIGAAGVPPVAGFNSRGVAAVMQFVPEHKAAIGKRPSVYQLEKILNYANNFDEALMIARNLRFNCGAKILLLHCSSKQSAIIEYSPDHVAFIRAPQPPIFMTPQYISSALTKENRYHTPSQRQTMRIREDRLESMLQEVKGSLDRKAAGKILADRLNPVTGELQFMGEVVGSLATVLRVTMNPEKGDFSLVAGPPPLGAHAPVCFNVQKNFLAPDAASAAASIVDEAELKGEQVETLAELFQAFACCHWQNECGAEVLAAVSKARESFPKEPLLLVLEGLFALKNEAYAEAQQALRQSLALAHTDHRRAAIHLWLGRACDLAGNREQALLEYRIVTYYPETDQTLLQAAVKGLETSYNADSLKRMNIDFFDPDTSYY